MALLKVEGLTKKFGAFTAVDELSFQIDPGRCVALLGPNGAGKTTTLRMLAGLLKPSGGQLVWNNGMDHVSDIRRWIGYLPQMPMFYGWMSGREFLRYVGKLAHLSAKEANERAEEMLERVGLKDAARRKIAGYSGGMKQRLGLAQAMVHRPKLLMLDEPVSALDPIGRREVLDLMQTIREETTILFSTHVLHDAEEVCDDVLIMSGGQIAVQGSLQEVRQQHRKPIIRLQVDPSEGTAAWLDSLAQKAYTIESMVERECITLTVTDMDQAANDILAEALARRISIVKYEVGQTSLEDLFLKVVMK